MAPTSTDLCRGRGDSLATVSPDSDPLSSSAETCTKCQSSKHEGKVSRVRRTAEDSSFNKTSVIKKGSQRLVSSLKNIILRAYILIWHELSLDPRVRPSPWSPPVSENEVEISNTQKWRVRRVRLGFLAAFILAFIGLAFCFTGKVRAYTMLWSLVIGIASSTAVTAGAHRLWSHHSYKATWQLRLLLMIFQTMALELSILNWARDHRTHHKFVDTDGDPHNSRRGFFFAHIGWLLVAPHPECLKNKKLIDTRDVERDWVVKFQVEHYWALAAIFSHLIPALVPRYFWDENLLVSHIVAGHLRHILFLNGTFTINSIAHMWGSKPYDKNICPTENMFVSVASMGDGWHNYHHVFPWDYKNAELWNYKLNFSAALVDLFAKIGWAYDLKTVSADMVAKRVKKSGDGSHPLSQAQNVFGWNDQDMPREDKEVADITYKKER